jgi:photosystem II stability/assembly factor-like uncharacterized protein
MCLVPSSSGPIIPRSTVVKPASRLGIVVAAVLLAGCSTRPVAPTKAHATTSPSALTPAPTLTPSPSPSPSPPGADLTAASVRPESVTFISADVGWTLGLSLCGNTPCLRLAKTVDAGASWSWLPSGGLSVLSTASQWQLRFADSQDGWISGSLLLATHDGGRNWTRIKFAGLEGSNSSVGALEAADGRVYAEIAEGIEPNTNGPVVLFESPVNVDSWHPVTGVTTGPAGFPGEISVAQGVFWVALHPAIVTAQGSQALSALYRSLNGVTWHSEPEPCPPDTVASMAAATSARVFVVCAGGGAAGSQEKSAYVSNNSGASYVRVADPPFGGDFEAVAASPASVSVGAASGATEIYASFNDGLTWTTTLGFGDGGLGLSDLGFTTATQGVVIHGSPAYPDSLQLLMTRDGGRQWVAVAVSPG